MEETESKNQRYMEALNEKTQEIASLKEKISVLERDLAMKIEEIAENTQKLAHLEKKLKEFKGYIHEMEQEMR